MCNKTEVNLLHILYMIQNEAEELYKMSGRYDLLNKFYQASGQWDKVCMYTYYTYMYISGLRHIHVQVSV